MSSIYLVENSKVYQNQNAAVFGHIFVEDDFLMSRRLPTTPH